MPLDGFARNVLFEEVNADNWSLRLVNHFAISESRDVRTISCNQFENHSVCF